MKYKIGDRVFIKTKQRRGIVFNITTSRVVIDIDEPNVIYCKEESLIKMPEVLK
jgi:hypothetical protein